MPLREVLIVELVYFESLFTETTTMWRLCHHVGRNEAAVSPVELSVRSVNPLPGGDTLETLNAASKMTLSPPLLFTTFHCLTVCLWSVTVLLTTSSVPQNEPE